MPGGGMKRETLPHWISEYGNDTVFLLGASMLQHPGGLEAASREVAEVLVR
jgi:ribulose 1,5-bisphosphate carboxylase large subunit-like protein